MQLTQDKLKEKLHYDPDTGVFIWVVPPAPSVKLGDTAGCLDSQGYIVIKWKDIQYKAHRLAFLYMTGAFPPEQTDHINGVRDDNRWENLRAVTCQENQRNRKLPKDNTSGVMGVTRRNKDKTWEVSIRIPGKRLYIGRFSDFSEAVCARKSAENKYNFHVNHGRTV